MEHMFSWKNKKKTKKQKKQKKNSTFWRKGASYLELWLHNQYTENRGLHLL